MLQKILLADTRKVEGDSSLILPSGAADLSVQNGGHALELIHILATADDSDGKAPRGGGTQLH